jgi:DNA-binding transcriptional regulator GbsR (MarR family)
MSAEPVPQDGERLHQAVEQLTAVLVQSGMPRMAARVFAYALAEDSDRYTAADFADALSISPAAVSGAVRHLVAARLLFKDRLPGSRADVYRLYDDDAWSAITNARMPMLWLWEQAVHDAADLVGRETRGGRRLTETEEFFRFMREETSGMIERWKAHRRTLQ